MRMTSDLAGAAASLLTLHPDWRAGQALFNALAATAPDLADKIRGTEFDPFYDDAVIDKFWERLEFLQDLEQA